MMSPELSLLSNMAILGNYTPETNIAPENGWLEYQFPFGMAYFQVPCFRECILNFRGVFKRNASTSLIFSAAKAGTWNLQQPERWWICGFSTPGPAVAVTTQDYGIFRYLLVCNPFKPSFATATGWGRDPMNMLVLTGRLLPEQQQ